VSGLGILSFLRRGQRPCRQHFEKLSALMHTGQICPTTLVFTWTIVRITPARYQDGVNEIPRHFGEGLVVSVEIGRMSATQAARLVDFCSGYLVGASGWLFRAADRIIVLTPTRRNVADVI
jgi:FtsZ-interacting cell division protein YlmF